MILDIACHPKKIFDELQWKAKTNFEIGIKNTVDWYMDNQQVWEDISPSILNPTPWKN